VEAKTPEAVMTGVIAIAAVALFLAGMVIGVFAAVAVAVHREDRSHPPAGAVPPRLTKYARYLNDLVRPGPDGELSASPGDPRR
jgi:hypothetical protein